jgi:GR25 family glycosyltransferase involved in LPS biosynthesis
MNPFDFFNKIFYINLDSRPERKEAAEALFSKYGIKAERFPAIQLSPEQNENLRQDGCFFRGDERPEHARFTKSCSLSHLSVILRAKLMGYDNVLVFEDDIVFREDILQELSLALEDLKKQERWDMFYIGCNPLRYQKVTDHLGRSKGALAAHAYAVNRHFYDTILNIPFRQLPCTDMYYHTLGVNDKNNVYMALQNLAWQAPSYSTLEETNVDYFPSIQARYDHNMEI